MSDNTKGRFEEIIRALAASFLSQESNRKSMITVTRIEADEQGSRAVIYFTVFPESQEQAVLDFTKRQVGPFREYVKKNARLMRIPFFVFALDAGEKSRQKIDGLVGGV